MIKIVTDSTSYLPAGIVEKYGILVVPLKVQFGYDTYDETVGMSNRDFYHRLITTAELPTTSQPPVSEFEDAYRNILTQNPDAEILVLTVSSKLSGTCNSATLAAEQQPQAGVTIFDSLSAAMGLGLMVIAAAEMAAQGQRMAQILTRLKQMRDETCIVLAVDTLEYLRRGGRISAATAFLGTLLNTKPILAIVAGEIKPIDRVRNKDEAINRLFAELEQKLSNPDRPVQAGVMHAAAEADMDKLAGMILNRFNVTHFFTSELGPVIGAHVGPGALGAGFCPEPS